ncbi:MAG: hypothetical protein JEZ14_12270 [Marinilabiliaceae bacterium]|nr:hypothetical protein [Marinilabiliaceae bacterium]
MLHAIEKGKASFNFNNDEINWRQLFKTSEDSLTSSVFERMFYLPVELFWKILKVSSYGQELPDYCGSIQSKEFWPKWDASNTDNSSFVEPDLFIRFEKFDLIIEAKRYDNNQQDPKQWNNQIIAYNTEYSKDAKQLFYLALGGIRSQKTESVEGIKVVKCRWKNLLDHTKAILNQQADKDKKSDINDSVKCILEDLITVFHIHGFATGEWFKELPYEGLKLEAKDLKEIAKQLAFQVSDL